jgi:hypothetical protein
MVVRFVHERFAAEVVEGTPAAGSIDLTPR